MPPHQHVRKMSSGTRERSISTPNVLYTRAGGGRERSSSEAHVRNWVQILRGGREGEEGEREEGRERGKEGVREREEWMDR